MASLMVGAMRAGGMFAGPVGWALGIGAALIDTFVIMPALRGKGRVDAAGPRLLDLPVGSNVPGAPRIWAIGGRVRVPTHVLWQSEKVREAQSATNKTGTNAQIRRVWFDALIALNDWPCVAMQQLHGNGKLIIYNSRNVHGVTSSRMALSIVAGPRIRLTAQTTLDPDFVSIFEVNDAVELRDWVQTNGTSINTGYFKVVAVVHHTTLPSYIELVRTAGRQSQASWLRQATPSRLLRSAESTMSYSPKPALRRIRLQRPGLLHAPL